MSVSLNIGRKRGYISEKQHSALYGGSAVLMCLQKMMNL